MSNELRVRQNFLGGKVDDNPLTAGATTLTSSALAAMVAIGSTQHLPIVLDPDGIYGEPEIAYVTAHSASATTATILRGQEGTTARQHNRDVDWVHGPTVQDLMGDAAWIAPTLQNSWVNYGSSHAVAGYRKDASGFVHLKGLVKSGTVGSVIFTLPVGYRPVEAWLMSTVGGGGSDTAMSVLVAADGTVTSNSGTLNSYVSLNGLTFLAEQ